ncbi:MAG: hypothetical protein H6818_07985 [Phycisphaerales bacterium]|nr:hypothetical protein [Phycisphaerales bacterium]
MHRIASLYMALVISTTSLATGSPVRWEMNQGGNGHYYEFVAPPIGGTIPWQNARAAAESSQYDGEFGYLATMNTAQENQWVAMNILPNDTPIFYYGAWLGGMRDPSAGGAINGWSWVTTAETWAYTNWALGEPNLSGGNNQFAMMIAEAARHGEWNDAINASNFNGYIVEYAPEPATLALLAPLSLIVCTSSRRRRNAE